jgi:quercetin dioxygenase-like cupin family protein
MINVLNWQNAKQVPFDLEAKIMFTSERIELIKLILKSGEELSLHKNPVDVLFYVINGKGILTIEDHFIEIQKDSTVFVEKEKLRGWKNSFDEPLEILVTKFL